MPESTARIKALACLGQVVIQTIVGVLYKASQAVGGGFKYSTTSAITIAEFIKLCLSALFHYRENQNDGGGAIAAMQAQLSWAAVVRIWLLSFLYAFNNQLSFFTYMLADPGTIFLFKAASTLIVAVVQCTFIGKKFKGEQWRAMMLQGCGMIVVQYDPCKAMTIYSPLAYGCMFLSTLVTALTSVCNEYFLKEYNITMNIQNMVLYAGGVWMNLVAFLFIPNPNSNQAALGFFDGYSSPLPIAVVASNALIGLAITAVYKYADAVTKCIAQDITAVILCIISSFFFGLRATVVTWCGVFVVTFSVYLYMEAGQSPAPANTPASPVSSGTSSTPKAAAASDKGPDEMLPKRYLIRLGMAMPIIGLGILLLMYPDLLSLVGTERVVDRPTASVLKELGVHEAKECLRSVASSAEGLSEYDLKKAESWGKTALEAIGTCMKGLSGKMNPNTDAAP